MKLLNIDQIKVLDINNQQVVVSMEGYSMENNATAKRWWVLVLNTSNKYMKCYNDRKVWIGLLSQTSTLLYKDAYRRYTHSKASKRT